MPDYFFIRQDGRYVKIYFRELLFIESRKNYVRLVMADRSCLALVSMKQFSQFLPRERFCRVHRSYIVSMDFVSSFDQDTITVAAEEQLPKTYELPIGEKYRQNLLESVPLLISEVRSGRRYRAVTVDGLLSEDADEEAGQKDFE